MKTINLICIALLGMLTTYTATAQNNVGIGTTSPKPSAILDLESTNQGFLAPRMNAADRDAISNPAVGLMIYCLDCINPASSPAGELQFYNGFDWLKVVTVAPTSPLEIGDNYAGGIIFQIFQSGDVGYVAGEFHGKVCSSNNLGGGVQWTTSAYWLVDVPNDATSTTDGSANTDAIIAQTLAPAASTYAAGRCRLYQFNGGSGYPDWYLPSIDELNLMWENLADSDGNGFNSGSGDPNNLGGFTNDFYISSTETIDDFVWKQNFVYGDQTYSWKYDTHLVRAVRAF